MIDGEFSDAEVLEANETFRALGDRATLLEYMGPAAAAVEVVQITLGLIAFADRFADIFDDQHWQALAETRAKLDATLAHYRSMIPAV